MINFFRKLLGLCVHDFDKLGVIKSMQSEHGDLKSCNQERARNAALLNLKQLTYEKG